MLNETQTIGPAAIAAAVRSENWPTLPLSQTLLLSQAASLLDEYQKLLDPLPEAPLVQDEPVIAELSTGAQVLFESGNRIVLETDTVENRAATRSGRRSVP